MSVVPSQWPPQVGESITLGKARYYFERSPYHDGLDKREGGRGYVYRVRDERGEQYAFKEIKPKYRKPYLISINTGLKKIAHLPGMSVCQRSIITTTGEAELVLKIPQLNYAILMPWIQGEAWANIIYDQRVFSREQSIKFAERLALILCKLEDEEIGAAHCDICNSNVLLNLQTGGVSLVDVEDMFVPGWTDEPNGITGNEGYRHKTSGKGQWGKYGDRFAGAILLAEMLTWHNSQVRILAKNSAGSQMEHLFEQNQCQMDDPQNRRYQQVFNVLAGLSPTLGHLFERAWFSETLDRCPSLERWYRAITSVPVQPATSTQPPGPPAPTSFKPVTTPPPPPKAQPFSSPASPFPPPGTSSAGSRPMGTGRRWIRRLVGVGIIALLGMTAFAMITLGFLTSGPSNSTPISPPQASPQAGHVVFGPLNGSLAHRLDNVVPILYAGDVNVRNFTADVTFYNPYATSLGSWDVGIQFRNDTNGTSLWLTIESDTHWALAYAETNNLSIMKAGWLSNLDLSAGSFNQMRLVAKGSEGFFSVNGVRIAQLDLSMQTNSGGIGIGTGWYNGDAINGAATFFKDFTVWATP